MRNVNATIGVLSVLLFFATASAQFVDVSGSTGVSVVPNGQAYLGRAACFADFDGDGDQDLITPQGPGFPTKYYRNDGAGSFSDQTAAAGLFMASGQTKACVAADVDNDGDQDFYLCRIWLPNQLWINDGTGFFTNTALAAGVDHLGGSYTASFGDYDRDGDLDLYVGNYTASLISWAGEANVLYRNNGNGTFTDVTAVAGVGNAGLCFTGVWVDYNEDGWPDLFVGNDKGFVPGLSPDTTYRNNGNGTFTDVGATLLTNLPIGAMGSDFTDAHNDGGLDIFVSNVQTGHIFHQWDPVSSTYPNTASVLGIHAIADGWGCGFADFDNNGLQDLYVVHSGVANHLYLNSGVAPWTEAGVPLGAAVSGVGFSVAFADYDDDGRVDLFMPRPYAPSVFLRNTSSTQPNWLKIKLEGVVSNRDGLGATVSVVSGTSTQRQVVRSGTSYLSSNDKRLHFGLGAALAAQRIIVRWPSGQVQELCNIPANQILTIKEPSLTLLGPPLVGVPFSLVASYPGEGSLGYITAISASALTGIPLSDGRRIPIDLDPLMISLLTVVPNPFLSGHVGVLNPAGQGVATLSIPPVPALVGLTLHGSSISIDATASLGIRTILRELAIPLQ